MQKTVQLLTIDLDDTLWPCKPTIIAAERWLFDWLRQRVPELTGHYSIDSMRDHRRRVAREEPGIAHDMTLLRRRHLQILLAEYDYDTALADEAVELFQRQRNLVDPYADTIPALQELRQQYTLISITNGNAQVEKTPLAGLFHHNIGAADVGFAKPHPALFDRALELAGCEADETVHVGDDPLRDIDAARERGLGTVWVNRGGVDWPAGLQQPDRTISLISELVDEE